MQTITALKKSKNAFSNILRCKPLLIGCGPILCLVGPPGVGKPLTQSLRGQRIDPCEDVFGGVRDEAEIRGHRRTYIGAMPGKLMQAMKRAKTIDPVFLLDEIDKMNSDFRGDPASALLEVLDPEQNSVFNDHYLDLDYDLSKVLFICTANSLRGIPMPLRDRLEIIELSGYTEREKVAIGRKYLIPKQREMHGLKEGPMRFQCGVVGDGAAIHHGVGVRWTVKWRKFIGRCAAIVHFGTDASFRIKKTLIKVPASRS